MFVRGEQGLATGLAFSSAGRKRLDSRSVRSVSHKDAADQSESDNETCQRALIDILRNISPMGCWDELVLKGLNTKHGAFYITGFFGGVGEEASLSFCNKCVFSPNFYLSAESPYYMGMNSTLCKQSPCIS